MALPKVIAKVRSDGQYGDIQTNPITTRVYFVNPNPDGGSVGVLDARTNRIIASVNVGRGPYHLGINPQTNRIYVPNFRDKTVSVINGRTNRLIKTIKVGMYPGSICIHIRTNLIYVTTFRTLCVIDGTTNRVRTTILFKGRPSQIIINELTNRIYVTNTVKDTVSVINGNTQAVIATIKVGSNPVIPPAINTITNRIYVANNLSRFLSVIDGRTNKLLKNVQLGRLQSEVVVNPRTNRIYVISAQVASAGKLFMINGSTNKIISTMVIPDASSILINPITNHLFISDTDKNMTSVYDASTLKKIVVFPSVSGNIALNSRTNRLYVRSESSITVIQDAV